MKAMKDVEIFSPAKQRGHAGLILLLFLALIALIGGCVGPQDYIRHQDDQDVHCHKNGGRVFDTFALTEPTICVPVKPDGGL